MTSALESWDAAEAPVKSQDALSRWDDAPATMKAAPKPAANEGAEKPGQMMSAAAGAGEAVGRGALAVQQLIGKGAEAVGEFIDSSTLRRAGEWMNKDAIEGAKKLAAENAPYAEANPKSNFAGEVVGLVASPVNKLIPGGGATSTLAGAVAKGGAQGAALNALTTPVTNDGNYVWEKLKQGGVGALGGGAAGALFHGLGAAFNKAVEAMRRVGNKVSTGDVGQAADDIVTQTLGGSAQSVKADRPQLFEGLKEQVKDALKSGYRVSKESLERLTRAQTLPVPVPMLKGQVTRDPMQFAMEQNMRGIKGVGEPLQETLTAQNRALVANLDAMGASGAADVVSAGKTAIDALKAADAKTSSKVSEAYTAFKKATGKDLDVPVKGLAQDYATTLKEFGDAIPSAIRSKFEALGLEKGTQAKVFAIEDAEALIKSINRHYDPANRVTARALDDLRGAVQKSISEGAGSGAAGEAAALAKAARSAAKERFNLIDATPALKAAVNDAQPDKFIQKYILQGNKAEIKSMMDVLTKHDPQAARALADSVMGFIKGRVTNLNSEGNAAFSQAQLKQFVSDPNMAARLKEVIGAEKMGLLKQLNSVAEDALYAPVASAVNRSNTASAAANLVKGEINGGAMNSLLDIAKRIPILSDAASAAQASVRGQRAGKMIDEAVNPSVAQSGATSAAEVALRRIGKELRPDVAAARAGAVSLEERRRRTAPR